LWTEETACLIFGSVCNDIADFLKNSSSYFALGMK